MAAGGRRQRGGRASQGWTTAGGAPWQHCLQAACRACQQQPLAQQRSPSAMGAAASCASAASAVTRSQSSGRPAGQPGQQGWAWRGAEGWGGACMPCMPLIRWAVRRAMARQLLRRGPPPSPPSSEAAAAGRQAPPELTESAKYPTTVMGLMGLGRSAGEAGVARQVSREPGRQAGGPQGGAGGRQPRLAHMQRHARSCPLCRQPACLWWRWWRCSAPGPGTGGTPPGPRPAAQRTQRA